MTNQEKLEALSAAWYRALLSPVARRATGYRHDRILAAINRRARR